MKSEFWHDRWKKGQTGFHNAEVNARLIEHWPEIETLRSSDWVNASSRFQARGLDTRRDHVLQLRRGVAESRSL